MRAAIGDIVHLLRPFRARDLFVTNTQDIVRTHSALGWIHMTLQAIPQAMGQSAF